jgi:hypothetical protein
MFTPTRGLIMKIKLEKIVEVTADLELVQGTDGSVRVMSNDWHIVTFKKNGELLLHSSIPGGLGFKLDTDGQIVTTKEGEN